MKKTDKSTILAISCFILSLSFSTLASAETRFHLSGLHLGFGGHQNHHGHNRHYKKHNSHRRHYKKHNSHRRHYSKHNRHNSHVSHRHHYSKHKRHSYKYNSYRRNYYNGGRNRHYSNYRQPCHQVSKIKYDRYGVPHKIGGTQCYDRRGEGYIVSGSRYHIN